MPEAAKSLMLESESVSPNEVSKPEKPTKRMSALSPESLAMTRRIARKLQRRFPKHLSEDVEADAFLGLVEAASRYEASRAEPFEAFAPQRIRGAVIDGLRRGDMLSRRERQAVNKSQATDTPLPNPREVGVEALATVAHGEMNPEEVLEQRQKISMVREAITTLPERLQRLLNLHLVEGKTLREIATLFEVSEPRISQLYSETVTRLRKELARKIK